MLLEIKLADDGYCDGCGGLRFQRQCMLVPELRSSTLTLVNPDANARHTLRPDACKEAEAALRDEIDLKACDYASEVANAK